MNANTYLLLNTVLDDRPCVDHSLLSTINTIPFSVLTIAQQCFYVLYLRSTLHALLCENGSAYNLLIQYIADQQDLQHQAQMGRVSIEGMIAKPPMMTLPRVVPAGTLEMRIVVIGGGTVGTSILRQLLDVHPGLMHPSRITVITRQPENLNFMAARGIRCLGHTKGRRAISACDVCILACQAPHLQYVMEDHFWVTPTREDPDPAAVLKPTTLVFSCVAAFPTAKLSAMMKHDENLIIRADVPAPSKLPGLAASHEEMVKQCVKLQVRRMADHDSFLKPAVEEAHTRAVENLAGQILMEKAAVRTSDTVAPDGMEERAAHAAALHAINAQHVPPPVASVLLEHAAPSRGFISEVWSGLQQVAETTAIKEETAKASNASAIGASPSVKVTDLPTAATKESALLCSALAALPEGRHDTLSSAIMKKYGVRAVDATPREDDTSLSAVPHRLRMPRGYTSVDALYRDLQERYLEINAATGY